MGYLGVTLTLRDVTIARDGKRGLGSANDVTYRKCKEDFGRFGKSQSLEMSPASGEDGWLSLARGGLGLVSHEMGWGRWKSQNRKIVPLSPYVRKPLNSKVIKSFVPELWSRKCFSYFEILCSMLYKYEYCMSISHISGYLAMSQ